MDELFNKIQKLIAEKLEIDESKITLDSSFRGDLGADSLDTYELVYAIEEELGVSIPDDKANEFETVRDAYEFIKAEQAKMKSIDAKVTLGKVTYTNKDKTEATIKGTLKSKASDKPQDADIPLIKTKDGWKVVLP